jgi:hypothetical protein
MKTPPKNLQSLKLRGLMAELPEWIKGLQNLVKLKLVGTRLSKDGAALLMQDIGKLRNLSILSLVEYRGGITIGEVQFKSGLFMSLKVLDLYYSSPTKFKSVKFDEEAMPKLEVLRLCIGEAVSFCGLEHLQNIKEIHVRHYWSNVANHTKLYQEMREQLDKVKMGHLLKME